MFPTLLSCKPLQNEFKCFQKVAIGSEKFTIGRGPHNNLNIAFLAISRNHCKFFKNDKNWILEDHSTYGVYINGVKLGKGNRKQINHEDLIILDESKVFVYKFINEDAGVAPPSVKRIKLEPEENQEDIIHDMKIKFEESQNFEMKHIENKIESAKQIKTTNIILKEQLQLDMKREIAKLESECAIKIENLKGEKNDVERLKTLLIVERDAQLATLKENMERKIAELMEQIRKHTEIESELIVENNLLKEKLLKEREEFLSELNRESSLKQDMLNKLEAKMKEQAEQLRLAKEKMAVQLNEAQENAQKSIESLKKSIRDREVELETQASERIKQQTDQSSEVISSLKDQLEKVCNQLNTLESENVKLLQTATTDKNESTSKTLTVFGDLMESELQCSICSELFVSAMTLNCSHTFCKYCITMWKKKKMECPICRSYITSECKSLVLDSFIEKMVQNLTEEMKQKRKDMLQTREEQERELIQASTSTRRRSSSYESEDSEYLDEEEEEEYEWGDDSPDYAALDSYGSYDYATTDSDSNSGSDITFRIFRRSTVRPGSEGDAGAGAGGSNNSGGGRPGRVAGRPDAYYGGYGRCFTCGARGHWAPGCPLRPQ